MDREINVSVRNMVEFILRGGSIDSGYMQKSRLQDGVKVHQKIQKARKKEAAKAGFEYDAEVRLRISFEYNGFIFNVNGIADGICRSVDGIIIEEIKSTARELSGITEDESHWHMAQAKCYGHMYCEAFGEEDITINLTYASLDNLGNPGATLDTRTFTYSFTSGELKAFFYDIAGRYFKWAEFEYNKRIVRDASVKNTPFPYENYRRGQREFAVLAYRAVQGRANLFIEAPTGTGKTISALFPAVKSLAEGLSDKIFYLTAKTITRQAAQAAADLLRKKGAELSYTVMTAKDKICFLPERACASSLCPFADGHFDRVNDALWELINSTAQISRGEIEDCAKTHSVCPYELMLDASLYTDIIICDYNYAFNPSASLKRFFGENADGRNVLLIDEAHNLVDRAREMFSAELWKSGLSDAKKAFKGMNAGIYKTINKIGVYIRDAAKLIPDGQNAVVSDERPEVLYLLLTELVEKMDKWLAMNQGSEIFGVAIEFYFRALDFLRVYEIYNERYTTYVEKSKTDTAISLLCLDPSENLSYTLKKAAGCVFFSATLTPLSYFKNVLGGTEADKIARLPSPFDAENYCVVIENRISTKYKDRSPAGYEKTADAIYNMVSSKKGNYFAFFSSYEYLRNVCGVFHEKYPHLETIIQEQDMTESAREDFLAAFKADGGAVLAFAVLGGVFSEGIDLVGDRLIGAAVVGVGLPLVSPRRDALRDFYEETLSGGFEYAYMYPGMNKVMQAAGRVIRTESDRGIILLIDDRFTASRYTNLFPQEWRLYETPSKAKSLDKIFTDFWKRGSK